MNPIEAHNSHIPHCPIESQLRISQRHEASQDYLLCSNQRDNACARCQILPCWVGHRLCDIRQYLEYLGDPQLHGGWTCWVSWLCLAGVFFDGASSEAEMLFLPHGAGECPHTGLSHGLSPCGQLRQLRGSGVCRLQVTLLRLSEADHTVLYIKRAAPSPPFADVLPTAKHAA